MKARQLIAGSAFGPDVLKVIGKAFDDAWTEIEPSVSNRPTAIEAVRLKLANIVLSLAKGDSSDADALKTEAVRLFREQPSKLA